GRVDGERRRVAMGFGTGGGRGSGGAAGAAAIVDDDILPERLAQRLAQDARRGIGRASGREIDDKRDGTAGILLRRGKRHGRHRRRAAESQDEFAPSHKQIRLISPYADGVMARGHPGYLLLAGACASRTFLSAAVGLRKNTSMVQPLGAIGAWRLPLARMTKLPAVHSPSSSRSEPSRTKVCSRSSCTCGGMPAPGSSLARMVSISLFGS